MKPKLTLGMACYDDFDGVYFSVMALRAFHAEVMKDCEIIVVDNHPESKQGETVRNFMGWIHGDVAAARYIPMTEPVGTSAPRNRVFTEAAGKYVLCMDSHVLIYPRALQYLIDYYDAGYDDDALLQGPMMYDDLVNYSTHFDPVWREQMYGIWGTDKRAAPADWPPRPIGRPHDRDQYHDEGALSSDPLYEPVTADWSADPFEIPGQGLGLFTCRKDAWLGFNDKFRGFGGEELYIHEKFRQAGRRCLCLPFLRWIHRFGRPAGVTYPLNVWLKVRNYVIGHAELGWQLDQIHNHFVKAGLMPAHEWAELVADPDNPPEWPAAAAPPPPELKMPCQSCPDEATLTLDDLYMRAHRIPSDINEHVLALRDLASQCEHVTEFGMRHGVSTVALLAGQPKRFVTYDLHSDPMAAALDRVKGATDFAFRQGDSLSLDIEGTDLLFIDTKHTGAHLWQELSRHAPRVHRWIVLHDTVIYGELGEDGSPGLLHAVRRYLRDHPEWSVVKHYRNNHGLLVLSRDPRDKQELPGTIEMAFSYAKALARHAVLGGTSTEDQLRRRLEICTLCESRTDDRCAECGCPIEDKAAWSEQECPLAKWPLPLPLAPPLAA